MNLKISYRHLDSTESINSRIEEKLNHLKKYFKGKLDIHWVCSVDGHDQHKSEVQVSVDGHRFHSHATDKNLYNTLDVAVDKLESQMRKQNEKIKNKLHRATGKINFAQEGEENLRSDY